MVSLGDLSKEVYLRIDKSGDVPALKKSAVYDIAKGIFDVIKQAVASGEDVTIPQFGKFTSATRSARNGRNPHTGDAIQIPAKQVVKFRPSSSLKEAVAGSTPVPKKEKAKAAPKAKPPAKKAKGKKK